MARDSVDLFDAVTSATGRAFCVDSSKSAFRFRAVFELEPLRTFAILLARDYRAVVHSKMKRGVPIEIAASGWRRKMNQLEALTCDLPANRVLRLTYESLCENPRIELTRICSFLGIDFTDDMMRRASTDIHHIGGSPSKFDPSRSSIVLDRSYETSFRADELAQLRDLTGDVAKRWGY